MPNQSPTIASLAAALVTAQATLRPALKDSTNPHFRSKYADLQSVWEAARPALQGSDLAVAQTFAPNATGDVVTVVTTLTHKSGEWLSSELTLKPTKADPQGIGSAITYGRRYGLSAILGIVADEDDDGNGASVQHHPEERQQRDEMVRPPPPPSRPSGATPKWQDVVIHFGKNRGKRLGDLPVDTMQWYHENWQPKPFNGRMNPQDEDMRAAIDEWKNSTGKPAAGAADEDVPF